MTNDRAHRIANYWMNKPASDVKFVNSFPKMKETQNLEHTQLFKTEI